MNDNDIYITPEYSKKAWYLLKDKGFVQEPLKSPLFKKIMFDFGRHLPTLYKEGYAIEIHDNLFDGKITGNKRPDNPFANTTEIFIGGTKAYILSKELQMRHLTNHFNHHALSGDCQLRLYTDIRLLDKNSTIEIPDHFISDPLQGNKPQFLKAAYKRTVFSIPPKHRLRFIIGDTFPSLKWMKKRYRCNGFKALFLYPLRIGKLRWLI